MPNSRMPAMTLFLMGAIAVPALAQPAAPPSTPAPGGETLQSINADFERQVKDLERARIGKLIALARRQSADEAAATYLQVFRTGLMANLFHEAEPAAEEVLRKGSPSTQVRALAAAIDIIASAERGDYEQSLRDLDRVLSERETAQDAAALPTPALILLVEAYYQKLLAGFRYDIAQRAMEKIVQGAKDPQVREYAQGRLERLALRGKPAPEIVGPDVDGRPFKLSDLKGQVVLVAFWATWHAPNEAEVRAADEVDVLHRSRGLKIVGVCVDTLQEGRDETAVLPMVRQYLLDRNVSWTNVLNGPGDRDAAKAYGVREIPANFLIGRDGKILHVDLGRSTFRKAVAESIAAK